MEPLTLIAMASTTFKSIETMVSHGARLEDVAKKLGAWYGYASDISECEKEVLKAGRLKKLFSGTVEERALNMTIAKQKMIQQEKALRELLMITFGKEVYSEMIELRRTIKKQRENEIYRKQRRIQNIKDGFYILVGAFLCTLIITGVVVLIQSGSGNAFN
jgi:hypothetical protein